MAEKKERRETKRVLVKEKTDNEQKKLVKKIRTGDR